MELHSQFQFEEPLWNTSYYYNPAEIVFNELLPSKNTILHYSMHTPSPAQPIGLACRRNETYP